MLGIAAGLRSEGRQLWGISRESAPRETAGRARGAGAYTAAPRNRRAGSGASGGFRPFGLLFPIPEALWHDSCFAPLTPRKEP